MIVLCFNSSCKKELEIKSDKSLSAITTLEDAQAVLDQTSTTAIEPASEECSSDNYYLTTTSFNALAASTNRSIYIWDTYNLFSGITSDWGIAYKKVYYCNAVLDAMKKIPSTNVSEWNNVEGQALFKRGKSFWHVADIWALAFDDATADKDLGIPLRLNSDFNEVSVRASVRESYSQIIKDLKEAAQLLPAVPLHPIRPSKPAAYALLSRVFLSMRRYSEAKVYADSALSIFPALLDYNNVNATPTYPFSNPNVESIYVATAGSSLLTPTNAKIDSNLIALYSTNDLRKTLFFKSLGNNQYSFRGSYSNSNNHFSGLSSSEMYLIRAECFAREGNKTDALNDLNTLLIKRYKSGTFIPVTASDASEALGKILTERRKELAFRFTRWMDIKRLNKEGANIFLKRIVNVQLYELQPNSLRYAMAFPEDIISISGMQQNPR